MDGSFAAAHANCQKEPLDSLQKLTTERIGVVGLGYVGLPVSVALAEAYESVTGFDIDERRVHALRHSHDWTNEVEEGKLLASDLAVTFDPSDLTACTFYIVAVPTPVDDNNIPDLSPLKATCGLLAPLLKKNDVVVFESTVYPGATEEVCAPELEKHSTLKAGYDFQVAYSPERISPGDKLHGLKDVPKIVSASDRITLERIARVYEQIVDAGVHRAASIKVAEAAKVFENTQRDVNIALMNEFSLICDRLGIRSRDVVRATGTKWNALPFTPGLVGGHCIGVDPFYLTHKAQELGVHPELMLASRRRNEDMAPEIARKAIQMLMSQDPNVAKARVGILGVTFKENVPDMRNSKMLDLIETLQDFEIEPQINDPIADKNAVEKLGLSLQSHQEMLELDLLILGVPHQCYKDSTIIQDKIKKGGILMDLRSAIEPSMLRSDIRYWSL